MQWLLIKQLESLSEYSYATYIYNLIADDFLVRKGIIQELETETGEAVVHSMNKDVLYVVNAPDSNEVVMKLWYSVYLPKLVKQLMVDKVIYLNGLLGPHKKIRQPQIMLLFGMDHFVQPKRAYRWKLLSLKKIAQNVEVASLVFTYSDAAIDTLATILSSTLTSKIRALHPNPHPIFQPMTREAQAAIKDKYSGGEEYFLLKTSGEEINDIRLYLKAFSHFKKWQKSAMKLLVLADEHLVQNNALSTMLSSYYFRDDVLVFSTLSREDYHPMLASAYGFLLLTEKDSDLAYVLEAMQCGTPVMTFTTPSVREIAGDAPFFIEKKEMESIGQAMIDVYRSENVRKVHVDNGLEMAESFDFKKTNQTLIEWIDSVKQI